MALEAQFTISAACSGGNHFTATLNLTPGGAVTVGAIHRADILAPVTQEEREIFARVLLHVYARQLAGTSTAAQIKAAIEAKVLDLTVA